MWFERKSGGEEGIKLRKGSRSTVGKGGRTRCERREDGTGSWNEKMGSDLEKKRWDQILG